MVKAILIEGCKPDASTFRAADTISLDVDCHALGEEMYSKLIENHSHNGGTSSTTSSARDAHIASTVTRFLTSSSSPPFS